VAHINITAAPLVVLGLAGLLYGIAPRLMAPICWAVVAWMVIVGNFGKLLDLPDFAMNLSPLNPPAAMPSEPFASAPLAVLIPPAAAGLVLGITGFRRREVNT